MMVNDDRLPEWVDQARRAMRRRRRVESRDDVPAVPQVGELRLAEGVESRKIETRMVCVVGVDRPRGFAEVALASNESALATASDVVVTSNRSGLPFDVVIEVEIRGRVWLSQIGRIVKRLPFSVLKEVRRSVVSGPGMIPEYQRGIRTSGSHDQRAMFQLDERAALDALADDCRESLESEDSNLALVVDPVLFATLGHGRKQHDYRRLLGIAEKVAAADISMVPKRGLAAVLKHHAAADHSALDRYGIEGVRALTGLFERVLADPAPSRQRGISFRPRRRAVPVDAEIELEGMVWSLMSRGHRRIRFLTDPDVWAEPSVHLVVAELPSFGVTSLRLESLEVSL
jgi:hypothetical protein